MALLLLVQSETETATLAPPKPFEIQLDDPLAAQASRAPFEIGTWDQARALLHERSTELRTAEHGVARAEGIWRQALSLLLPQLGASIQVAYDILNRDRPPFAGGGGPTSEDDRMPTTPLGSASVSIEQTLIDLSAWRGLSGAAAGERSAELSLFDVRRRVTQGLAQSLISVVAAERAAEINRVGLRQALERVALTQRTFELGRATQLDVVRVRQDVAVARTAVISGEEQLRRTREALGLLLGVEGEVGVRREFALEGLLAETRKYCRPLAPNERRADLRAAEEDLDRAEASRSQAELGYLPRLGLSSNLFALTTDPGTARVASWSIAAVISFPLWEGGLREGLVEEREGFAGQVAEAAETVRRSIQLELARARRSEQVAKMLMDSAAEARDLAARTDAMTRRSFEIGRATSLELVESAALLRQGELTLALREFEWVQARLDAFLTEAQCEG